MMLERVGRALYGRNWQAELAKVLEVTDRHMRFIAAGDRPVSVAARDRLLELINDRRQELLALATEITPVAR